MLRAILLTALVALPSSLLAGCGQLVDQQAHDELLAKLGDTTLTVFPTALRREAITYDRTSRDDLGGFWSSNDLAEVTLTDLEIQLAGEWQSNQAQMAAESCDSMSDHLAAEPIGTEYALLGECMFSGNTDEPSVIGVHAYVMQADGTLAAAVLMNDHHDIWQRHEPKTVEGCVDVIEDGFREDLLSEEAD